MEVTGYEYVQGIEGRESVNEMGNELGKVKVKVK